MAKIVVLVGLPGSGKSTWVERLGVVPLSSDWLRHVLADDAADQSIHDHVFLSLRFLLRRRLAIGRPVSYVDATNLTVEERRPYVLMAKAHGCDIEAVFFDIALEVCRDRNRARRRVVPEEALERMAAKLAPPSIEEGFSKITVVTGA